MTPFLALPLIQLTHHVLACPESIKFGPVVRYIQLIILPSSPHRYFVPVLGATEFRFALVSVRPVIEPPTQGGGAGGGRCVVLEQVGWLDAKALFARRRAASGAAFEGLGKRKRAEGEEVEEKSDKSVLLSLRAHCGPWLTKIVHV